jgi:hypothetical protein
VPPSIKSEIFYAFLIHKSFAMLTNTLNVIRTFSIDYGREIYVRIWSKQTESWAI